MDSVTVTILVIIGVIAVIEAANLWLKLPRCNNPVYGYTAVITLDINDDVELKIENILYKLKWADDEIVQKIILLNCGLTDEQLALCEEFCAENYILVLAEPGNLLDLIISNEKNM